MFDEVGAVTDCDLLAKRQLIAPSSMDKAWSWRILEHPERERVTVLQPGDDLALGQHRLEEGIAGVLHAGEGG